MSHIIKSKSIVFIKSRLSLFPKLHRKANHPNGNYVMRMNYGFYNNFWIYRGLSGSCVSAVCDLYDSKKSCCYTYNIPIFIGMIEVI